MSANPKQPTKVTAIGTSGFGRGSQNRISSGPPSDDNAVARSRERTGILVLGPTGAGKSSFIATVTGSVLMAEAKAREEKLQRKLKEEQEEAQELHLRLQQNNQSATES